MKQAGLPDHTQNAVLSELLSSSIVSGDLTEDNVSSKLQDLLVKNSFGRQVAGRDSIKIRRAFRFNRTGKTTTLAKLVLINADRA